MRRNEGNWRRYEKEEKKDIRNEGNWRRNEKDGRNEANWRKNEMEGITNTEGMRNEKERNWRRNEWKKGSKKLQTSEIFWEHSNQKLTNMELGIGKYKKLLIPALLWKRLRVRPRTSWRRTEESYGRK